MMLEGLQSRSFPCCTNTCDRLHMGGQGSFTSDFLLRPTRRSPSRSGRSGSICSIRPRRRTSLFMNPSSSTSVQSLQKQLMTEGMRMASLLWTSCSSLCILRWHPISSVPISFPAPQHFAVCQFVKCTVTASSLPPIRSFFSCVCVIVITQVT